MSYDFWHRWKDTEKCLIFPLISFSKFVQESEENWSRKFATSDRKMLRKWFFTSIESWIIRESKNIKTMMITFNHRPWSIGLCRMILILSWEAVSSKTPQFEISDRYSFYRSCVDNVRVLKGAAYGLADVSILDLFSSVFRCLKKKCRYYGVG